MEMFQTINIWNYNILNTILLQYTNSFYKNIKQNQTIEYKNTKVYN